MNEEWKTIPRYPYYEASNLGNIRYKEDAPYRRFLRRFGRIRPQYNIDGYLRVNIDGTNQAVHVLVVEAFIGPRPLGCVVDHIDQHEHNNNLTNLRWLDNSANITRSPHAGGKDLLHEGEVLLIRRLKIPIGRGCINQRYEFPASFVAKMFKVSCATICRIWKSDKYLSREGTYV